LLLHNIFAPLLSNPLCFSTTSYLHYNISHLHIVGMQRGEFLEICRTGDIERVKKLLEAQNKVFFVLRRGSESISFRRDLLLPSNLLVGKAMWRSWLCY
jgi:hypothetical protein